MTTATKPKSQRALNRQQYNLTKQSAQRLSQQPTRETPNSSDSLMNDSAFSSTNWSSSLPTSTRDWQRLSPEELMGLSPTDLHQMQQDLSPAEAQALYQRVLAAVESQPEPSSPLSSSPLKATTGSSASSGDVASAEAAAESLQQPLSGKPLRRYKDLIKLLGLAAGVCVMLGKNTKQLSFMQDAETIGKYGPDVAESWARLTAKYEWLGVGVDWLIGGTEIGLMLYSTGQMLQEIGEHHGVSAPALNFSARNVA